MGHEPETMVISLTDPIIIGFRMARGDQDPPLMQLMSQGKRAGKLRRHADPSDAARLQKTFALGRIRIRDILRILSSPLTLAEIGSLQMHAQKIAGTDLRNEPADVFHRCQRFLFLSRKGGRKHGSDPMGAVIGGDPAHGFLRPVHEIISVPTVQMQIDQAGSKIKPPAFHDPVRRRLRLSVSARFRDMAVRKGQPGVFPDPVFQDQPYVPDQRFHKYCSRTSLSTVEAESSSTKTVTDGWVFSTVAGIRLVTSFSSVFLMADAFTA